MSLQTDPTTYRNAQFLWIGDELSPVERLALASFRDHGWNTILYTFSDIKNVPDGITISDGTEILSLANVFEDKFVSAAGQSFANFSDLFRYALLIKKGGWWFDADMVALKGPDTYKELSTPYFASTWEIHWRECATGCAMFAPENDPLLIEINTRATHEVKNPDRDFAAIGPHMIQSVLKEWDRQDRVAPFWEFCPYPWRQIRTTCFKDNRGLIENTLRLGKHLIKERLDPDFQSGRVRSGTTAVHLHNEIWRRAGISKTDKFHPASFVGRMMRRHGI